MRAHENAIDALLTRAQRVELIMRRVKPTSSPPAEQTARSPDAPSAPPLAPAGTCALDLSRASPLRALDADIIDKHISETLSNAHNTTQNTTAFKTIRFVQISPFCQTFQTQKWAQFVDEYVECTMRPQKTVK